MNGMTPDRSDRKKQQLLAMLIAASLVCFDGITTATADDSILISTVAMDCCPPANPCDPAAGQVITDGTIVPGTATTSEGASPSASAAAPQFDAPVTTAPAPTAAQLNAFNGGVAASSLASTSGSRGGLDAPNMLGDFLGARTTFLLTGSSIPYTVPNTGNRRFKVTENVSPIPQDRVYFNYNGYSEALQVNAEEFTSMQRYSFGGEKTFADGLFSAEMRMVVADGFDAQQTGASLQKGAEFGNLLFSLKSLLYSSDDLLIGGGLTFTVPTASDVVLGDVTFENETVFLAPFIGFVATPCRDTFLLGFLQTDFVAGGDSVVDGGNEIGVFQEQNFLYGSLSLGHWLYTDSCPSACVNGIAGLLELHYSTTLNDADNVITSQGEFDTTRRSDYLNLTSGVVVNRGLTNVRVAGGTSLRDDDDDLFDAEFTIQVNRFF